LPKIFLHANIPGIFWLDANNQNIQFLKWRRGQPNGGNDYENVQDLQELEQRVLHILTQTVDVKTAFIVTLVISNIFK
jgi:hypothetical protein